MALHQVTMEMNASGIEKLSNGNFVLYPNPTSSTITLRQDGKNDVASVVFTNTSGQVVMKATIDQQEQTLQIDELASGLYFVSLQDSEGRVVGMEKVSVVR